MGVVLFEYLCDYQIKNTEVLLVLYHFHSFSHIINILINININILMLEYFYFAFSIVSGLEIGGSVVTLFDLCK